jgi:MFS family permease
MPFFAFLRANAPFLAAGFLLAFLSIFGQTTFISIFAGEIRAEFGLTHGEWGAAYALGTLISAVIMLWAGTLTDRFRVRALGAAVLVAMALACLVMAANPYAALLPGAILLLRLFGQGMMTHTSGVAMARWFVASRGRALSIAALGFSVGEILLPLSFTAMKAHVDWHWLWVLAAVILLLALPLLSRLLRLERTPQSMSSENQSLGMEGRHWTRAQALRHPLFWLIMPALTAGPLFITAFFFQQVHLAQVKGWDHLSLVEIFPVYTLAGVAAMMVGGAVVDRFGTTWVMALYPVAAGLFFLVFAHVDSLAMAALVIVLLGLSAGAQSTIPVAFWAEFYGTRHIGAIRAAAGSMMVLGTALGPVGSGWLIDRGVNFPAQMTGIGLYILLASVLAVFAVNRAHKTLGPVRPS